MSTGLSVLQVMEELALRGETGISDLARQLSLPKSTAHRVMTILVEAGFVERNEENHKYSLTAKLLFLADTVRSRLDDSNTAHSYLVQLAAATRETANLGILKDDTIVYLDKVESGELFTIDIRVGSRVPAYCTGLGKAVLAFLPEPERKRYLSTLEVARHTPRTVSDKTHLMRDLAEIRKAGYAIDYGELLEDVCCIAAPVLDGHGRVSAAISVSSPQSRFHDKKEMIIPLVKKTAGDLSTILRYIGWGTIMNT